MTGLTGVAALPLLMVLTTLASAAAIFTLRDDQTRARPAVTLAGPAITLAPVAAMTPGVLASERHEACIPFLPGEDIVLRSDALAAPFTGRSPTLWLVTSVHALGYMRPGPDRARFFGFFALCVSATMGVALAGNLVTFVVFFEALTLATYPLVVRNGDEKTLRAGRSYLIDTLSGGAAPLMGALLPHALQATSDVEVGGCRRGQRRGPETRR